VSDPDISVTEVLDRIRAGQDSAVALLMPLVYDNLRALARSYFAGSQQITLEPTAVVNEAFVKMLRGNPVEWQSKAHFLAVAAKAMRQVVADYARRRNSDKRGGDWERITLAAVPAGKTPSAGIDLAALDDALSRLAELDPRQAQVVELRVLAGMTIEETAHALNISAASVERDWVMGKMWLRRELA
jgi:RNA polymerase sigma factor (TIGR02999 family)